MVSLIHDVHGESAPHLAAFYRIAFNRSHNLADDSSYLFVQGQVLSITKVSARVPSWEFVVAASAHNLDSDNL